ncbi:MAG: DUF4917 family protein [Pseudobdellovibrionaceae bacterium]|nr:DUF4917 family protein [Pseudobdellovibrionaceae bacterium]
MAGEKKIEIVPFQEALRRSEKQKRHLLLGNGFSVGLRPDIFSYRSMTEKSKHLSPELQKAFNALQTVDFEEVIRDMETSAKICGIYAVSNNFAELAKELRQALIQTIADHHPNLPNEIPDEKFEACVRFLKNFKSVYTLNYDMLLYWVLMRDNLTPGRLPQTADIRDDGFAYNGEDFLNWSGDSKYQVHYLHGALHLFERVELEKLNYSKTRLPLKEQFTDLIFESNLLPLFVTEGDSEKKLARINRCGYLNRCIRSLRSIGGAKSPNIPGAFFVYGASLAATDNHIVEALADNNCRDFYIGIYGDPGSAANKALMNNARRIKNLREQNRRTAKIIFFDSGSAAVWDGQALKAVCDPMVNSNIKAGA